jgi:hypothetical protein
MPSAVHLSDRDCLALQCAHLIWHTYNSIPLRIWKRCLELSAPSAVQTAIPWNWSKSQSILAAETGHQSVSFSASSAHLMMHIYHTHARVLEGLCLHSAQPPLLAHGNGSNTHADNLPSAPKNKPNQDSPRYLTTGVSTTAPLPSYPVSS